MVPDLCEKRSNGTNIPVRDDRVGLLDGAVSVVLLQIFETNLQMELARPGNDVLAGILDQSLQHGVADLDRRFRPEYKISTNQMSE
jgi:hypothetical protein